MRRSGSRRSTVRRTSASNGLWVWLTRSAPSHRQGVWRNGYIVQRLALVPRLLHNRPTWDAGCTRLVAYTAPSPYSHRADHTNRRHASATHDACERWLHGARTLLHCPRKPLLQSTATSPSPLLPSPQLPPESANPRATTSATRASTTSTARMPSTASTPTPKPRAVSPALQTVANDAWMLTNAVRVTAAA